MQFIVVRLGKDSVEDIKKIDNLNSSGFEPYLMSFSCKQVEQAIKAGAYVLIYLGSDNNKGTPTEWKQGIRALGRLEEIIGWENFQSTCELKIKILSVFPESLDQISFLERSPVLYANFSQYPIIGVKSSRNNSVQRVNGGEREETAAVLTAIAHIYKGFEQDVIKNAPELRNLLAFRPAASQEEISITQKRKTEGGQKRRGQNLIFYGAPGTGKSYAIDKTIQHERAIKTVFHADTLNSDFIGSIKPVAEMDSSGRKVLSYKYLPGPFLKAFIMALQAPNEHVWLVIEEINRAPAASVFGEVFQLLDRKTDGSSAYSIDFPDSLCAEFVREKLGEEVTHLYVPGNLTLMASMNSSDQGVMPLDTAFKRRWQFVYMPLDFEKSCPSGKLEIVLSENEKIALSWADLAQTVNKILSESSIPEDRHLGPYFLNDDDLASSQQALTGKLFMYLWDDVLRHGLRSKLFDSSIRTYGQLVSCSLAGKKVFSDRFVELTKELPVGMSGQT